MQEEIKITEIDPDKNPDFCFKLVMIGTSGVGKTSLVKYEMNNKFLGKNESTVIFDHSFKNFSIFDKIVRLQIWDLCGQETYYSSIKNFYRSSTCIIIVFSLDNLESFNFVDRWIEDIKGNHSTDEYVLVLIGNKSDLVEERIVSKEIIENYCKDNEIENYFETSAKTGDNIHEIFKTLVKKLFIKFAMPIIDNQSNENEKEVNINNNELNKNILFCNNKSDCLKACFCHNQ